MPRLSPATRQRRAHVRGCAITLADELARYRNSASLMPNGRPHNTPAVQSSPSPVSASLTAQSEASSSRTLGITVRPYSSMLFINRSCAKVPALYLRSNRFTPSAFIVATIFRETVSGDPT